MCGPRAPNGGAAGEGCPTPVVRGKQGRARRAKGSGADARRPVTRWTGYNLSVPLGDRSRWRLAALPLLMVLVVATGAAVRSATTEDASSADAGRASTSTARHAEATTTRPAPASGSVDSLVEGASIRNVVLGPGRGEGATPIAPGDIVPAPPDPPALPQPAPIPLDEYAPTPTDPIGTIRIPKIGIDDRLFQGMSLTAIDRGPSHWPGTAAPGGVGNMVIAGHRTTRSHPFLDLDVLVPGDEVIVTTTDGEFTYEVTGTEIISPADLWIAHQAYRHTGTLFACHPKGSARQRIAVHLRLVDHNGAPVDDVVPWHVGSVTQTDAMVMVDAYLDWVASQLPEGLSIEDISLDFGGGETVTLGDALGGGGEPQGDPLASGGG